jgi:hypothetical protein
MSAIMEKLIKEATTHTPLADFDPSGRLKLEGRSFPEDVAQFFDPLIDFVKNLEAGTVRFDINLEYFNTASSKKLLDLFKHLDANNHIQTIKIHWHYEEGDDDSVETAEIFEESLLRCEFIYHEYAETELD